MVRNEPWARLIPEVARFDPGTAALGFILFLISAATAAESKLPSASRRHDPMIHPTNYFGWEGSWLIENGLVEVIVVPAVGRVMQFKFINEPGVFWEDSALRGRAADPASKEWINFGGDKTWPSPQSEWGRITGRDWPPPAAFDSMAVKAKVDGTAVVLESPVDSHFGIRTFRRIELDGREPAMRITTKYEKTKGRELRAGIWVITQLNHPVRAYAQVARGFADGFGLQSAKRPPSLIVNRDAGYVSLERDATASYKIGGDGDALLWVGDRHMLLIESPRLAGKNYPDKGSSVEIYTNPNPKDYVELELLGPLESLKRRKTIEHAIRYTLQRRSPATPDEEARKIFNGRR